MIGNVNDERMTTGAPFGLVDASNGLFIIGSSGESIDRLGWQNHEPGIK